jgi:hypothetical protein
VPEKRLAIAIVVLLTLVAGCGHEDVIPTGLPCGARPLGDYCAHGACPDYETAVVEARATPANTIGQCGPWRFVSTGRQYETKTLFFDGGGATVAARLGSDAVDPGDPCGSFTYYGFIPTCVPEDGRSRLGLQGDGERAALGAAQ